MTERNITVYIQDLDLSVRVKNALIRNGIMTLNELENSDCTDFFNMRGVGPDGIQEVINVLDNIDAVYQRFEEKNERINALPDDLCKTRIEELPFNMRVCSSLHNAGINNIGELVRMSSRDIFELRNIGMQSREKIQSVIDSILSYPNGVHEDIPMTTRNEVTEDYKSELRMEENTDLISKEDAQGAADDVEQGKGFDFEVIDELMDSFFMKPACMTAWFGLSRQGIYDALDKRSPKRREKWTGYDIAEPEIQQLFFMIQNKQLESNENEFLCHCFNNRCDNFAAVFVYADRIRCYFLRDMPKELQESLIHVNMQRYTKQELSGDADGSIVYILKKPYFIPDNPNRFRAGAQRRGLTIDEYSRFVSGYPMTDQRNVTDNQIIDFLRENCENGKVYISSDPKNQWIRSMASRNGFSMKDFIELYGFESKMDGNELTADGARERHIEELKKYVVKDNIVYFPTDSRVYRLLMTYATIKKIKLNDYVRSLGFVRTLERPELMDNNQEADMQAYKSDGSYEEKIFAQYPLLGSKIIPPETLNKFHDNTKNYIDTLLRNPSSKLPLRVEMQITLSLINHAKNWNNDNNSSFWSYIVLQYGYRDANGAAVHIIQNAMEDALKKTNRLFIEDANGRAFKSTAVIHAMSTKKSWMALLDFLFDFYKNNLNWKLLQDDPLLDIMIRELQHKLSGESSEDVELTISSQVYSFQEGVRKLILLRPKYTRVLFEKLLHRIDDLINSADKPIKTYEDQLCEEWFKEKLLSIANSKKKERQGLAVQSEVAIDYTRIRAKYVLKNENCIQVVLPDIRLKTENFSRILFSIKYDGRTVYRQPMSWYGNELGKTLNSVSVSLPDYGMGNSIFNIQVSITCDYEEIYNSEDELTRRVIAFSDRQEVGLDKIRCGNYTFVIPSDSIIECENVVLTEIIPFRQQGLKAYFAELNEGYAITLNGMFLSFDNENSMGIRVISPMETKEFPVFTKNDINYHFVYKNSTCNIIIPDTDQSSRYKLLRNNVQIDFEKLKVSSTERGKIYVLPIDNKDICQIQIVDLGTERLIYDRGFMAVLRLKCRFNKEFYFQSKDFIDSTYEVQGDDIHEVVHFSSDDDEVSIPYRDGFIHKEIPKVQILETSGRWMTDKGRPAWYIGDIPQDSLFRVETPPDTKAKFLVGDTDIEYDGQGIVSIGNILQSLYVTSDLHEIKVEVELNRNQTIQKYVLANVFCKEGFTKNPEFWYQDGKLYWDCGNMFIGKADRKFTLTLFDEMENALTFDMDEQTEYVTLPEEMNAGNYQFEISILSGGLFKKTKEVIAQGDCIIGDENVLRFKDHRIVVTAITDEFKEEAGHIEIKKCYIEQIEFKGIQETSEGLCPVYSGIISTDGYRGERYEFSFDSYTTRRGIKKMMVNPVRIVYIGNRTLCITDSEGDGLYYYSYYDGYLGTKVFALTDYEYTEKNKGKYSIADLYSYQTERI